MPEPASPRVVVLDDDPTGTQTVRDLPVLTRWAAADVDWALAQDTPGFFVLTNTRSLSPDDAAARTREVVERCLTAADASFGYSSSRLAEWVAEKSDGAVPASDVAELRLDALRSSAGDARLPAGRVVVLDALVDDDLRAGVRAILAAERDGRRLVYRVGPSFVRARFDQPAHPPLSTSELASLAGPGHGLVVVGSHVGRTGRQLARVTRSTTRVELDVAAVLDGSLVVDDVAAAAADALASGPTVLATSRTLVTGRDEAESLDIARRVSAALTGVVGRVVERHRPAYVLAKGGITSSDVATESLHADRVWVRGSLLPGIVSLWEPVSGPAAGLPLVVFPGNVGDDDALAQVLDRMEAACGSVGPSH